MVAIFLKEAAHHAGHFSLGELEAGWVLERPHDVATFGAEPVGSGDGHGHGMEGVGRGEGHVAAKLHVKGARAAGQTKVTLGEEVGLDG